MKKCLLLATFLLTSSVIAQTFELESKFLTPSEVTTLIGGGLPKKGSLEESEDFKTLLQYQQTRTTLDCELASKDIDTSLQGMFGGEHKILTDTEVKRMNRFLLKAKIEGALNITLAKKIFKRPRPYVTNLDIKPCIKLEKSYAYPSGHTALVRLYARILSQVYPERSELLMLRATQYSENRIIGGVHHPSDVAASNVMSDYLAQKMIRTEDFQKAMNSL